MRKPAVVSTSKVCVVHAERAPMVHAPVPVHGVVFIKKNQCKGCELCIEFCPKTVLVRSRDFNPKGYHYPIVANGGCINCRLCATVCPEYAIFSIAAPERAADAAVARVGGKA